MTERSDHLRLLKYYTLFGFFVIGIVTVLIGQLLPILSARFQLNDAQSGTLLLAQFTGSLLGTLLGGHLARRYGFVLITLVGLLLMIIGLPGLNSSEFAICWASILIYGSGLGITIPAINLLTIEATPASLQSSSVNLINFAWGVGAIFSQPFVAFVSDGDSLVGVTAILVIALLVFAVGFLSIHRRLPHRTTEQATMESPPRIWQKPASWLFILFGFFVIGIESGLGAWLTTYSQSLANGSPSINLALVFFSFMVLGRGLASVAARRLAENVVISICSTTLLIGIFLIVVSEDAAMIGAAIAGLGTSAIFPTNMVRFTKIFGPSATQRATPLFISGICGAASLSWLIGLVSSEYGSLRLGIVVLLVSAAIVVVLQMIIALVYRKEVSHGIEV